MSEKFKSLLLNDTVFYGFTVILVGICSFGLGRASVESSVVNSPKLSLDNVSLVVSAEESVSNIVNEEKLIEEYFIASKSGTKYHLPSCPGAKQIKTENRITFASKQEAEAAGYKPAANCPELQ